MRRRGRDAMRLQPKRRPAAGVREFNQHVVRQSGLTAREHAQ